MSKKSFVVKMLAVGALLAGVSYGDLISTSVNGNVITKVYEFTPNPSDLGDLSHDKASAWGISFSLASDERVTDAKLTGDNLYNWLNNEWNDLYINLIDRPEIIGVKEYGDNNMGTNGTNPAYDDNYFQNWTGTQLDRLNYNGGTDAYLNSVRTGIKNYSGEMVANEAWTYYNQRGWTKPSGMTQNTEAFDIAIAFNGTEINTLTDYIRNDGKFGFGVDADCHFYNSGFKFRMTTETRTSNVPEPSLLTLLGCGLLGLVFVRRRK